MTKKDKKIDKSLILKIPLEEAEKLLNKKITEGSQILEGPISNINQWKNAEKRYNSWNSENFELLKKIFKKNTIAKDYSSSEWTIGRILISDLKLDEKTAKLYKDIEEKLNKLNSIKISLGVLESKTEETTESAKNKVFYVHGTDCEITMKVLAFLKDIGLEPIILKDLAGAGKTLIDEVQNQSDVKYAIALLTPDNVGGVYSEELQFRATQNVILEVGFFVGKYGRKNVSTLHHEDIELPADYHGYEYIKIDETDDWKSTLTKELKNAGFNIDLNKI
ncbi:MAG: nucleotide-binding protein [Candidatus Cloacimonetes bacterium]|nr:nucleotide-binding protein [Candidatus Cloacimonadota bacterium]MBL7148684.1 nucleotide-binding protein [Candidatus Cloacimonadota bacterium]